MATPRRDTSEPVKLISQIRLPYSLYQRLEAIRGEGESTNGLIVRLVREAIERKEEK